MGITKPEQSEYAPYYHNYISTVEQNDLAAALNDSATQLQMLVNTIPTHKHDFKYGPGKWSIKEVIAHLIDTERVFAYRALSFARGDKSPLPSFDENDYAAACNAANRTWQSLTDEFSYLRKANILFFENLTADALVRRGVANNSEISVRALGYAIVGHQLHHMEVINERYLKH